ncbi:MAG TPA: double-strand break repair protein AddB [Hypericibacter adhaerens]|uniref:double-strand break repair protein AddB n=1 Tax=Hypericibacter adhaerens TaxID=2602016 RepID=UPI002C047751|nr:double-strand break repair protein AddB [Hypericibacter adhaerens]HWA41799.1 double-strand break repair protein AddB [Hypericibacter adhaerens]
MATTSPTPVAGRVFSIPAGVPFLDALARRLLEETADDALALGRYRILLPTRRACRALQETFLRLREGRPLLLPQLTPLGDIDEEELALAAEAEAPGAGLDLPPAMPPLMRQLMLARLVAHAAEARKEPMSADRAALLAGELARLVDQVATERLSFERLSEIVPGELARHWQLTVEFLEIVTKAWPKIEKQAGAVGAAERRNRLLERQAEAWRRSPPEGPVIAAGSTGSIPATADLIAAVAQLPQGRVLLPGLWRTGSDLFWQKVEADPSHPQHGLGLLLRHLGIKPAEVLAWPAGEPLPAVAARQFFLAHALVPATLSHRWRAGDGDDPEAAATAEAIDDLGERGDLDPGLRRLDCPGQAEEALAIAVMLREAAEQPALRAALVTPDRRLARRVAAELKRWSIEIDDSAGSPLTDSAPGAYLRLVAQLPLDDAAPVPLLALLKHPLAAGGLPPGLFRQRVRALERAVLRGPRPAPGFEGLRKALAAVDLDHAEMRALPGWLDDLAAKAAPFLDLVSRSSAPLADLIEAHIAFAETLAADDQASGAARLWSGDAGEAAATFLTELLAAAQDHEPIAGADYPAFLDSLMAVRQVRPRYGRHPRLFIWGPLEARLQQVDLMILGGLNEMTWPATPAPDPWMSRPMREAFGLPPAERRIGLSAHDFQQACGAARVVLTRARKIDGTPTVPSRWLTRLDALMKARGLDPQQMQAPGWMEWAEALDSPDGPPRPVARPRPTPPVAVRPTQLSVTQIETWMRDPYAIYARHILKLVRLEPIDAAPEAAERGTIIHAALDSFIKAHPGPLPENALATLLGHGRDAFGAWLDRPSVWAFWWPRFERIAAWFLEQRREELAEVERSLAELKGKIEIDAHGHPFTLSAKADRIDRLKGGGLGIIDYKTGAIPTPKEVVAGYAPQLPLEAAIAVQEGFGALGDRRIRRLAYWRLSGGDPAGIIGLAGGKEAEPEALAVRALERLRRLIQTFADPATPYLSEPHPEYAPRFSDYAHLARIAEWSVAGEGE